MLTNRLTRMKAFASCPSSLPCQDFQLSSQNDFAARQPPDFGVPLFGLAFNDYRGLATTALKNTAGTHTQRAPPLSDECRINNEPDRQFRRCSLVFQRLKCRRRPELRRRWFRFDAVGLLRREDQVTANLSSRRCPAFGDHLSQKARIGCSKQGWRENRQLALTKKALRKENMTCTTPETNRVFIAA